ncbi:MAG: hypothetical protein AAF413_01690 [Patescibacteria group bacterium]
MRRDAYKLPRAIQGLSLSILLLLGCASASEPVGGIDREEATPVEVTSVPTPVNDVNSSGSEDLSRLPLGANEMEAAEMLRLMDASEDIERVLQSGSAVTYLPSFCIGYMNDGVAEVVRSPILNSYVHPYTNEDPLILNPITLYSIDAGSVTLRAAQMNIVSSGDGTTVVSSNHPQLEGLFVYDGSELHLPSNTAEWQQEHGFFTSERLASISTLGGIANIQNSASRVGVFIASEELIVDSNLQEPAIMSLMTNLGCFPGPAVEI